MAVWEVVIRHKNGVKETKTIACGCGTGVKAKILSDHERSKNTGKYVGAATPKSTDICIVSMREIK
jgi:hypothetical protein